MADWSRFITFGASPRATIGLIEGARALAFLRGRSYALPQDVIDLVPDVLRHRLVLSYEALSEGLTPEAIIAQILQAVPVPDKPLDSHVRTAPTA
jgi:MoxR-like ATPase